MIAGLRDPGIAFRVQPPFQHVALDDEGIDHLTLFGTLRGRTDVDQERTTAERGRHLVGRQTTQAPRADASRS